MFNYILYLFATCMFGIVRSINHSGAVIFRFYQFLMHGQFCLISSIPHVFFVLYVFLFVLYVLFFFVDDASEDEREDDLKHQLLDKKFESNDSSRREKHSNISSIVLFFIFFINGSSLINILMCFFL